MKHKSFKDLKDGDKVYYLRGEYDLKSPEEVDITVLNNEGGNYIIIGGVFGNGYYSTDDRMNSSQIVISWVNDIQCLISTYIPENYVKYNIKRKIAELNETLLKLK